jgi:hypothetical protein
VPSDLIRGAGHDAEGNAMVTLPYRSISGFILAPLVVPLLYLAATSVFGGYRSADLALYIAQYAYLAALLGGLPVHVTLSRLGWVTLHDYIVYGVLLGLVATLVTERPPIEFSIIIEAGMSAVAGAIAGGVFWLIARPDRSRGSRPVTR